jgi:hypothetical protein
VALHEIRLIRIPRKGHGIIIRHMLGLTDSQLGIVMDMARSLPVEKRDLYFRRIGAMLVQRGRGHFNDSDVSDVARLALTGLVAHQPAA